MGFEVFALFEIETFDACFHKNNSMIREVRCVSQSNVLGWSFYHSFLQLWLKYFESTALLVTYLDTLASDPAAVMRAIECHLGLTAFDYGGILNRVGLQKDTTVYNMRKLYPWEQTTESGNLPWNSHVGREGCYRLHVNAAICEQLFHLFQPQMAGLKRLADAGKISALPRSWIDGWELHD
eukprot:TRINITY_DN26540_c0_g1_i1.p1 TRINITY_DN26540_c0_g1~~TRINITY_DN26540_c0_g1_i1.p1  ORF type:complete len:181 (-),score=33.09 TRINITY_DN26540_c0_g1_i1:412-954(-)